MVRLRPYAILALFALAAAASPPTRARADDVTIIPKSKAEDLRARPRLKVAPAAGQGDADALLKEGVAYANSGRFERAAASLRRAAELSPQWALAHYNLGWVYHLMRRWEEAASAY